MVLGQPDVLQGMDLNIKLQLGAQGKGGTTQQRQCWSFGKSQPPEHASLTEIGDNWLQELLPHAHQLSQKSSSQSLTNGEVKP